MFADPNWARESLSSNPFFLPSCVSPLSLPFFPSTSPPPSPLSCSPNSPISTPSLYLPSLFPTNHLTTPTPACTISPVGGFLFCCQSSRRIDDDSLEEQIRQTSEDSRALRELMEGERGKLRQSLEELQQLHSQVSTPILSPEQGTCMCPPRSLGTHMSFPLPCLFEKWLSSDRSSEDGDLKLR